MQAIRLLLLLLQCDLKDEALSFRPVDENSGERIEYMQHRDDEIGADPGGCPLATGSTVIISPLGVES
jgi:hypothetical protein